MKAGDLRRFRSDIFALGAMHLAGGTFMVLKVIKHREGSRRVDILVDGKVEESWGYPWVKENSEVLNEAR